MKRTSALVVVLALAAAACSEAPSSSGIASLRDSDESAVTTTLANAADAEVTEQAFLDFARCMRDQGIDMTDPTVDADGNVIPARPNVGGDPADREAIANARLQCLDLLEGAVLGSERRDDSDFQDQALAYAQCMRENGIDLPDPDFTGGGGPGGGLFRGGSGGEVDRSDPAFQAANETCREEIPGFERGPRAGRSGG